MKKLLIPLAALLIAAACAVADEAPAEFTLEEFLQVSYLASPTVSPDGRHVAYMRRWRDLEEDAYQRQLWLADVKTGETRRLSWDGGVIGGLDWRPDGALSYLSARGEGVQVWVNPLDGGEPRPVTDLPDGVSAYWWSPDGTRLAVLAPPAVPEDEEEADEKADWTVFDRLEHPEDFDQLWIVPVGVDAPSEAEARQLTEAPLNPQHAAWSPDGRLIALTYNPRFSGLVDEDQRVGLLNVESGELEQITSDARHASQASFSPDGKTLAFFMDRGDELRAYLNLKDLFLMDLRGRKMINLTQPTQACLAGYSSTPEHAPFWSADSKSIYLRVSEGRDMGVRRLDVKSGEMKDWISWDGNITDMDLSGGVIAVKESELHRPGAVWAGRIDKPSRLRRLDTTDEDVADFDLIAPRRLELPGVDGVTVEGFLFLPPGKTADDGPFPFVMEMHGGPYSRYGNTWTTRYPWQVLSRRGYAVFIANPRGGTAYGEELLRGVYRNFGTDDYRDLMAACDALVERGIADPKRMGFTGYSYGGLSTNNVISRTDRFAAAVSIAGIFNYVSAMGQNNPQLFIDSYDQPWAGDLQLMWEHSPASRSGDLVTPTLIMHGKEDHPVDPRQSIELFSYLQLNGVPSRLVLYPDEGHGINRPSHMIDYQTRELEWFDHYLLGDEDAAGADEPVPVEKTRR